MSTFDLTDHGLSVTTVHRNLSPSALYEHAIRYEKDASIAENGALVAYSGAKTGRSPKDKRVVEASRTRRRTSGGAGQHPARRAHLRRSTASGRSTISTRASGCTVSTASPAGTRSYRIKVRVICSRPYHALFMHTMLIRPTTEELANFGEPDFVIYNAGAFPANRLTTGMTSKTSIDLSLEDRRVRHPRHRIRRRNEEGRVHGHELLHAQARHALDALLGDRGQEDRRIVAALRPLRHRQDDALRRSEAPADRRRRALLERRRHLQHRRRLLRQGDQPHARERAGDFPGAALRRGAGKRRARRGPRRRFHRHEHHGEHARRVSDRVHPQREDPLRRRPSDRRDLPHLRRVRRAAAGQHALARAGDVPLHQRLHGQGRRHRDGRHRAAGHVLALLRRAVPRLASEQVRRTARREDARNTTRTSGWSTPAGAAAATASASAST